MGIDACRGHWLSPRDSQHLRHYQKSEAGTEALQMVFKRLAWSMNALFAGRIPSSDWLGRKHPEAGRELAGGYRAAVMHLKGDWEFFNQVMFSRRRMLSRICAHGALHRPTLPR